MLENKSYSWENYDFNTSIEDPIGISKHQYRDKDASFYSKLTNTENKVKETIDKYHF